MVHRPDAVSVSRAKIPLPAGRFIRPPANARQSGTTVRINTNDGRPLPNGVLARGNQLYYVLHHGCTPVTDTNRRSCIRIFQFYMNGDGTVTLGQDHRIAEVGRYLYYPAATVNAHDELLIAVNRSAAGLPVQIAVMGRAFADPPDTVRDIRAITNSPFPYAGPLFRWGDYSGASLDANGVDSWFTAEYARAALEWGTKTISVSHNQLPAH